jgi:hypothetical protein
MAPSTSSSRRPAAGAARRRQRSTRITVAVVLLVVAAVLVVGGLAATAYWSAALAALGALVLGAAATRIMHSELLASRRDANAERATLAREYAVLTEKRINAHRGEVRGLSTTIRDHEAHVAELETALVAAQQRLATATRKLGAEARRAELAEDEARTLARVVEESDSRAAEAIVHLAELEQEVETLRAELAAWQSFDPAVRRHA